MVIPVKARSNTTKNSQVECTVNATVVNLFFDGTKNNLYNTDIYKGFSAAKKAKYDKDETSYANAYSNVAWMFLKRKKDKDFWVYIEGMGSFKNDENDSKHDPFAKPDEMLGAAFGTGITGVVDRAKEAFGKIERKVGGSSPDVLHINVFGFSRGATTARHFIHLAKSTPNAFFKKWKLTPTQVRFKFVGLFDTVSSYQYVNEKAARIPGGSNIPLWQSINYNFDNDVEELKLDFCDLDDYDKKEFTKVFHIIAADEYRENFSVTNIDSAISGGYGYEVTMNGAHADIGGAYHKESRGKKYDIEIEDEILKNWLIDKKFYTAGEIKRVKRGWVAGLLLDDYYQAERGTVYNDIHKISLEMMARIASKYGGLNFTPALAIKYNSTRGAVNTLMGGLPNEVVNGKKLWGTRKDVTLPETQATKNLRHQYIHWSAKYTKGSMDDTGFGLRRFHVKDKDGKKIKGEPYRRNISG